MAKDYSQYDDKELSELLHKSKHEAEAAFSEIYLRHSQRVYAYCLKVTANEEEARDIFQETFFRFFEASKSKKTLKNIGAFIIIIARNLCLNYKRDKKTKVHLDDINYASYDNEYSRKELLDLINESLELLSFDQREAFVLRQYQGYSYKEIAEITGDNENAVKNRVWRAKERIKEILSPYLEDVNKFD